MSAPAASLFVAVGDKGVCIRIVGRANFASSLDFKTLVDGLMKNGQKYFILDLSECLIMDSTFLGVMARIAIQSAKMGADGPWLGLYRPNERIKDLLDSIGVLHLFQIKMIEQSEFAGEQGAIASLKPGTYSKQEMTRTSLDAHQLLMEINPANVTRFKDVARFLAEDLKKMEGGNQAGEEAGK